jgi:hypothetical protein
MCTKHRPVPVHVVEDREFLSRVEHDELPSVAGCGMQRLTCFRRQSYPDAYGKNQR